MTEYWMKDLRERAPRVHCITNYVTAGDVANLVLAAGGSPIMAQGRREVEDVTSICHSLVLNMGTLEKRTVKAMLLAGRRAKELGHPVSRPVLAAALIEELDRLYQALENDDLEPYRSAYRASCVNLGKTVQLLEHGQRETAQAVGIDDAFGLIVRDADGRERVVRSGEVSVRGLYGYVD